jgi:dipeptidyl aminopeptidase/acylaminoacyl peptidase
MLDRDLRATSLWKEVEGFYRAGLAGQWGRPYVVAEAVVAPGGTLVAYVGEGLDELDGRPWKAVYVVDLPSGQVRPVSAAGGSARSPAWSPTGTWLAFLAEIDGREAVLFWDAVSGRLIEGIDFPDGVDRFVWAHDIDRVLAWSAARRPELGKVGRDEAAPWMPAVRSTLSPTIQDVATQEPGHAVVPWPSPPDLWIWEAAWTEHDSVIALASDRTEPPNWYQTRVLHLTQGEARGLHRPARQAGCLTTSPDGRRAAWIEGLASDRGMIAGAAVVLELEGLLVRRVEPATWQITDLRWRDADRLAYLGIDDLETVGGDIDAGTLDLSETWRSPGTCGMPMPSGSPAGEGRLLVAHEDWHHPPALQLVGGGEAVAIGPAPEAEGVAWLRGRKGSMSEVRWETPDGTRLSGLLVTPDADPPYPLVVNVHGGPVWAWRNTWEIVFHTPVSLLVSRGFAVLQPNGRGSVGRGAALTDAILGSMGGRDLQDYTSAATALVERGIADPQRLSVIGHSYGGLVACALAGSTDLFAAAVALSPATDWVSQHYVSAIPGFDDLFAGPPDSGAWERSPLARAGRAVTPTLVVGCEDDDCTPVGQAIEFYRALAEQSRAPAALAVYPAEGHGIRSWPALLDQNVRIVSWLERYAG